MTFAVRLLRFEFEVDDSLDHALTWITAHTLLHLLGVRSEENTVDLIVTRFSLVNRNRTNGNPYLIDIDHNMDCHELNF